VNRDGTSAAGAGVRVCTNPAIRKTAGTLRFANRSP
jgi:hypothetical protein